MFSFIRGFRRYIRRSFPNVGEDSATKWHRRLQYIYLFCTWNVFGAVLLHWHYSRKHGTGLEEEQNLTKAEKALRFYNIPKATYIKISGLSEYQIDEIVNPDAAIKPKNVDVDDLEELM